ncbi:MAG: hypothetical protein WKG01_20345 [Kofleriaceae bacterium]
MASHRNEVHAYDYVNHPYHEVRRVLLADPLGTLQRATRVAASRAQSTVAELRASVGGVEIAAAIELDLIDTKLATAPDGRQATHFILGWKGVAHAALFPTMRAVLAVYALTPTETQIDLTGTYEPPLGILGEAVDAIAMHHVARDSVAGFIQAVAKFLRHELRVAA